MIIIPSMILGYRRVVEHVIDNGRRVSPRGLPTREVPDVVVRLDNPMNGLVVGTTRKLNYAIAAAEAVQLIGGFLDPALLLSVSKNFAKFMDDGTFHGGYGERIGDQLVLAAQKLHKDPDTRQAVITIWDKDHDNLAGFHDYPCTLSLVFQVRDNLLELHVTMRSNDVWLGFPYDVFQFTQLQITLARVMGFGVGPYYHHAVSLHLYETDLEKANNLREMSEAFMYHHPNGFGNDRTDRSLNVYGVIQRARMIGQGEAREVHRTSASEQWYIRQLEGHVTN